MTNFEKIKNMSVEELANFIESLEDEYPACKKKYCKGYQDNGSCTEFKNGGCRKATENWLKDRAEGDK